MKTNSAGSFVTCTFVAVTLALATISPVNAAPRRVGPPTAAGGDGAETQVLGLDDAAQNAERARVEDPTPERWLEEARAKEALGDLEGTEAALVGYLEATNTSGGDDASPAIEQSRAEVEERLADIRTQRRGKVEGEPESTHREALDAARAKRLGTDEKEPGPAEAPVDKPPKEKIVKKWYFWVTILAIAGSAGAITGIAITAARDDRKDALDARKPMNPGSPGAVLLRF